MSISWHERNKLHNAIDNMHLTLFIHDIWIQLITMADKFIKLHRSIYVIENELRIIRYANQCIPNLQWFCSATQTSLIHSKVNQFR